MGKKQHREAITRFLKSLADDWLIVPKMPIYAGPRTEIGKIRTAEQEQARRHREQYHQIQYLKNKKWIEVKKTQKGLMVKLSDLGKTKILARTLKARPKLIGGKSLILIFDFPEPARKGRDAFRYFIKTLGFKQLQLSVWKSDQDCWKELKRFIKDARISEWVKVFLVDER